MGSKYREYNATQKNSVKEMQKIHPVWRGVGFALMVLVPIMAYATMKIFMEQNDINGWIPITNDMLAKQGDLLFRFFPDPLLYVKLIAFIACLVVYFAVFTFLSFLVTGMLGATPQKADPYYVPPIKKNIKRRSR